MVLVINSQEASDYSFSGKITVICGPKQSGKTTLANNIKNKTSSNIEILDECYSNYDQVKNIIVVT